MRISLVSWCEESDEVVTASNLASDEDALKVSLSLLDASSLNIILWLNLSEILNTCLIDVDHCLRIEHSLLVKVNSCVDLEKEDVRSCLLLCLSDNISKTLKKLCRLILHVVIHIKSHVVQGTCSILRPILNSLIINSHERVNKLLLVYRIVLILLDKVTKKCSTIRKHSIPSCRRAVLVCLSPVRKSCIIVLLLIVLCIIREILDTLCAVRTIFTLSRYLAAAKKRHCSYRN